jgi:hypothetical protein
MELSGLNLSDFGFDLKNRELAALIWLGAIAAVLALWQRTGPKLGGVIRAFFAWKLQVIFALMTIYTVVAVALMFALNIWEWQNLKTTLLWWITVGFGSVFEAQRLAKEPGSFRRLVSEAVGFAAAIAFIVSEFGSFPLIVELIIPLPIVFIALVQAVAATQPKGGVLLKPLGCLMTIIGIVFLSWSIKQIAEVPAAFFQWNTLREFTVPIILSIAFIPFLYGLGMFMEHETLFSSLKVMWARSDLAAYAQRRSLFAFGFDLDAMQRLARDLKMNDVADRQGVEDAINQVRKLKRRERNPAATPPERGWSPYEAIRFLEAEGVVANDWHPSFGEWRAESAPVKLGEGYTPNSVIYYLSGSEYAVTRIVLMLDADYRNDTKVADASFYAMVVRLLERTLPLPQAQAIFERLHDQTDIVIREDGWRFSMTRDDRGTPQFGGYARNFKLTHPAHVPWKYEEEAMEESGTN